VNILGFVLIAWLAIVVLAWCLIEGTQMIAERKAATRALKAEADRKAERALKMLTYAGLHKNAHAIYRRNPGTHRLTRTP
jgi:hypothetical protein